MNRDRTRALQPDTEGSRTDRAKRALEEAAEWRGRLEEATPEDTAAFERWLCAHLEHQRVWQALDAT
jgi:ferric-dicitrate binding protein FerR (iron transport regulator)